jgi:hypothetical protein
MFENLILQTMPYAIAESNHLPQPHYVSSEFLKMTYILTMFTSREAPLAISQPTPAFLGLVEKSARDNHDKTLSTKEKLAKLNFTRRPPPKMIDNGS